MSNGKQLPYDVTRIIFEHVDDFETLRSLLYTNRDFSYLAQQKLWADIRVTSHTAMTKILTAILNFPHLRELVRSIRLPDYDCDDNQAPDPDWVPEGALDDEDVLDILEECCLDSDPSDGPETTEQWSWATAKAAAIMTICPNLETVVADTYPCPALWTLDSIFPFSGSESPQIPHWQIVPDILGMDHHFPLLLMNNVEATRVDLIPRRSGEFNEPEIGLGLPLLQLDDLEDLRLEDGLFEFELLHGETADEEVQQQLQAFLIGTWFQLGNLAPLMSRLHWKITAPFMSTELPRDSVEEPIEAVDKLLANAEQEMRDDQADPNDPYDSWPVLEISQCTAAEDGEDDGGAENGQTSGDYGIQTMALDIDTGGEGQDGPIIITPSLTFARAWVDLDHAETTTGSIYGHPFVLIQRGYVTKVLPRFINVLVIEERWHPNYAPSHEFMALYRYELYRDLRFMAWGAGLPKLLHLVFIPKRSAGYWPGLPERVEWKRLSDTYCDYSDPFPEMTAIVKANGDEKAAARQRKRWTELHRNVNWVF